MGTFILFLLGYPGHTELLINQTRHLFQQLLQLTLVFLGLVTPAAQSPSARFHQALANAHRHFSQLAPAAKPSAATPELMSIPMKSIQRQWNYIFEGKATLHDQPCPNASILVRLMAGNQSVAQGTITGPDGSYKLQASITADEKDPVDWSIEAYTPDFDKVEISGRRIIQGQGAQEDQDKKPIVVNNPVEFVVSLAK